MYWYDPSEEATDAQYWPAIETTDAAYAYRRKGKGKGKGSLGTVKEKAKQKESVDGDSVGGKVLRIGDVVGSFPSLVAGASRLELGLEKAKPKAKGLSKSKGNAGKERGKGKGKEKFGKPRQGKGHGKGKSSWNTCGADDHWQDQCPYADKGGKGQPVRVVQPVAPRIYGGGPVRRTWWTCLLPLFLGVLTCIVPEFGSGLTVKSPPEIVTPWSDFRFSIDTTTDSVCDLCDDYLKLTDIVVTPTFNVWDHTSKDYTL